MNKIKPVVSIVIPSYNHEKYIEQSIRSIWEQTYSNVELIVLDDGSKDNTSNILLKLKEEEPSKINIVIKDNEGATKTINRGIEMATGKYFMYLSSDDYLDNNVITRHVEFLESIEDDNIAGCYGDYTIIDKDNNILSFNKKQEMKDSNQFLAVITRNNQAVLSASTIRMKAVRDTMFDPEIFLGDWDFFLNLTNKYRMLYMPGNAYFYRKLETGMNRNLEKMFNAREQIFNKYKNNEIVKSQYGINTFKAQINMSNAISFFHIKNYNSAKPFILKAWKLSPMIVLKNISFVIKIYMGETLVEFFRRIKRKILK